MRQLHKHFIPVWFLAMVVAYHGYNLCVKLSWAKPLSARGAMSFDASTQLIRSTGYMARYFMGERNEILGYLNEDLPVQFFERRDFDFMYPDRRPYIAEKTLPMLRRITRQLDARGVEVAIVLLPPKSMVVRDRLPKILPASHLWREKVNPLRPDSREELDGNYNYILNSDRRHMVDLFSLYKKIYRENPARHLYLPTDYHWTSFGISMATMEVVFHLNKRGANIAIPTLREVKVIEPDYALRLLSLLLLPDFYLDSVPKYQFREQIYDIDVPEAPNSGRLILAGDSHSLRFGGEPYNFGSMLARATHRTLHQFAKSGGSGQGSFGTMIEEKFQFQPGDLFVWEFQLPFEFTDDFELPTAILGPLRHTASASNDTETPRTDQAKNSSERSSH